MSFSDYIIFVDESGDHGLLNIDAGYPVFVLSFCIFNKRHYVDSTVAALQHFKLAHFGHDQVILHERDIRKDLGSFAFLKNKATKQSFMDELTAIVEQQEFTLVTALIDKQK